jgi:acetoin utilization deacetylase AcuC-like enzyme
MTFLYMHDDCLQHVNPPGHPERVERLGAVAAALAALDLDRREAPLGADEEVLRCHPEHYLARIEAAIPVDGWTPLDADTAVSRGSLQAARRAVGGCAAAVDAVLGGEARTSFVACRPPGHHAERETAMGFCLFGNVAIAAKRALDHHGLERVAIVDFDVHHGNGTQDLIWDEPRVLFVSTHQMPLYPGSGATHETGAHGQVLNLPLAPGTGSAEMRRAYEDAVFPALEEHEPELVLISAGFDADARDPLANLVWRSADFGWVTARAVDIAARHAGGRVISTLEGGYDLTALGEGVAAHVTALMEAER